METKGKEAFDLLYNGIVPIIDQYLYEANFFEFEYIKNVELHFSIHSDSKINLEIKFYDVNEFQFYYRKDKYTYVEDYKFFFDEVNKEYYLSLDPDQSTRDKSVNDCDLIIAKDISIIVDENYYQELITKKKKK